nr:hypothetical protein [Tanacetum cinerariifolium]
MVKSVELSGNRSKTVEIGRKWMKSVEKGRNRSKSLWVVPVVIDLEVVVVGRLNVRLSKNHFGEKVTCVTPPKWVTAEYDVPGALLHNITAEDTIERPLNVV